MILKALKHCLMIKIEFSETIKKGILLPYKKGIIDLANLSPNKGIQLQCEQLQLQEEKSQAAPKRMRTIDQFHSEAMRSFDKCLSKDKNRFLTCWANDMREILLDNGISQRDFLTYSGASA